ncbi:ester cyclase [Geodermatophilus chilensis]|uniref:ester cyclase n=1 Tax=Geodermatophilus chilensis TaxID=2035835 RepID=UPI000C25D76D|nr:ester cyclase [Geodermatophilus chilensis]
MDALTLTPTEQRNLDTMAAVVPQWNRRDVAGILAHYDEQITWHDVARGRTYRGKREVGDYLRTLFTALPDLRLDLTTRLPHGDCVAEEYTITGTHLGSLFGIPPTGRPLRIRAVSFVRMREGRLAEDTFYVDLAGILGQLGLFPPLGLAETRWGRMGLRVAVLLRSPRRGVATHRARRGGRGPRAWPGGAPPEDADGAPPPD